MIKSRYNCFGAKSGTKGFRSRFQRWIAAAIKCYADSEEGGRLANRH